MTVCGNCGTRQGPFERLVIGGKTMQHVIVTCGIGARKRTKNLTPDERAKAGKAATLACLGRRARGGN